MHTRSRQHSALVSWHHYPRDETDEIQELYDNIRTSDSMTKPLASAETCGGVAKGAHEGTEGRLVGEARVWNVGCGKGGWRRSVEQSKVVLLDSRSQQHREREEGEESPWRRAANSSSRTTEPVAMTTPGNPATGLST